MRFIVDFAQKCLPTVLHIVSFTLFFTEFTKCPQEILYSFKFTIYAVKLYVKTLFKTTLENHKIVWNVLKVDLHKLHSTLNSKDYMIMYTLTRNPAGPEKPFSPSSPEGPLEKY